jgi:hypothetical protein
MILGVGIAANALLGPLVYGVIKLRESANMENQLLGGELTSLLIAAPMAVVGGILWWRGNALAPFIAIGPAGFALYNYIQFVLVPDYSRYAGNNERFFPLYLTLVILAWALIWRAWNALGRGELAPLGARLSRTVGAMCVLLGSAFALAWLATIAAQLAGASTAEYAEHPTAFWLVRLMDLGFVHPARVVGWYRASPHGGRGPGAYAFIGTQTLLACAVAEWRYECGFAAIPPLPRRSSSSRRPARPHSSFVCTDSADGSARIVARGGGRRRAARRKDAASSRRGSIDVRSALTMTATSMTSCMPAPAAAADHRTRQRPSPQR